MCSYSSYTQTSIFTHIKVCIHDYHIIVYILNHTVDIHEKGKITHLKVCILI